MDHGPKFTCPCYDVTGESFRELIERGVTDVHKIQELTGAGLGCGCCEDRMFMVIREAVESAKNASPMKKDGDSRPRSGAKRALPAAAKFTKESGDA